MTTISHKNLSGTQLHENKGVAAATDNHVLTASSGASVWKQLDNTNLIYGQLVHARFSKAAGTVGGAATAGAWTKYPFSSLETNEVSGASMASSVISLPAGTYEVYGYCTFSATSITQIRLRNTTSSVTELVGHSVRAENSDNQSTTAMILGRFDLAGTRDIELQYHTGTSTSSSDLGAPRNAGEIEVYGDLLIKRII
jgi:hypothetical protein